MFSHLYQVRVRTRLPSVDYRYIIATEEAGIYTAILQEVIGFFILNLGGKMYPGMNVFPGDRRKGSGLPRVKYRFAVIFTNIISYLDERFIISLIYHMVVRSIVARREG